MPDIDTFGWGGFPCFALENSGIKSVDIQCCALSIGKDAFSIKTRVYALLKSCF